MKYFGRHDYSMGEQWREGIFWGFDDGRPYFHIFLISHTGAQERFDWYSGQAKMHKKALVMYFSWSNHWKRLKKRCQAGWVVPDKFQL